MTPEALTALALQSPGEPDRWAGAVGRLLGLTDAQCRALARAVAVAGDDATTRLTMIAPHNRAIWDSQKCLTY